MPPFAQLIHQFLHSASGIIRNILVCPGHGVCGLTLMNLSSVPAQDAGSQSERKGGEEGERNRKTKAPVSASSRCAGGRRPRSVSRPTDSRALCSVRVLRSAASIISCSYCPCCRAALSCHEADIQKAEVARQEAAKRREMTSASCIPPKHVVDELTETSPTERSTRL